MALNKTAQMFVDLLDPNAKPGALIAEFDSFGSVKNDPINAFVYAGQYPGTQTKDRFGTTIIWHEGAPGSMPHVTDDDKVCPDVCEWQKYVHAPDLATECADGWEDALALQEQVRAEGLLSLIHMPTGIFEELHYLMGFEDTFINLMEEPEAMHELIAYLGDYRLAMAKLFVEKLHPDAVLSHDDWGSKQSLFMQPDVWREFFKPEYERLYRYFKDNGVYVLHHADSHCQDIVEDMVDIHIDAWQGVLSTNDIPVIQQQLAGRMVLMGGIDSVIDREDQTEEEIRAETRRVCDAYGPGGHFIPCLTYGLKDSGIFPLTDPIIKDEIHRWNKEHGYE